MARHNWGGDASQQASQESELAISKYNSAALINQRLHNSWLSCRSKWNAGDFEAMNGELDIVWSELYADASKEQREQLKNFDKELADTKSKMPRTKTRGELNMLVNSFNQLVKEKWLFLKDLEKHQGLGKAYKSEFDDDFD